MVLVSTNLTLPKCFLILVSTCILLVVLFQTWAYPSQYCGIKQRIRNGTSYLLGMIILKKRHLCLLLAIRPFKQYILQNYNFPWYFLLGEEVVKVLLASQDERIFLMKSLELS